MRCAVTRKQTKPTRKPSSKRTVEEPAAEPVKVTATSVQEDGTELIYINQDPYPIILPPYIDPLIREAIKTFISEINELLETYTSRHWVVYRGRERLGVSLSIDELYADMRARGIQDEALYYHPLAPIVTCMWRM